MCSFPFRIFFQSLSLTACFLTSVTHNKLKPITCWIMIAFNHRRKKSSMLSTDVHKKLPNNNKEKQKQYIRHNCHKITLYYTLKVIWTIENIIHGRKVFIKNFYLFRPTYPILTLYAHGLLAIQRNTFGIATVPYIFQHFACKLQRDNTAVIFRR